MKLALLVALVAAAPLANALVPLAAEHVHVLTAASSRIDVEVHYDDGVGSTRFAFVQLTGPTGSTVDRLKPTPECTEWIGTFTEAAVLAPASEPIASLRATFSGPETVVPLAAPREYRDLPMTVEVASKAGGLNGRILVCDRAGDGLVHLTLNPVSPSLGPIAPGVARISLEATS